MASITDIRERLALSMQSIAGLSVSAVWPDLVSPPMAIVSGPEVTYDDSTMTDDYTFYIQVYTGSNTDRSAQAFLDEMCASSGSMSLRQAVNHEPTLGGTVQYCEVVRLRNYGVHRIQEQRVFGCEFQVHAVALQ